MEHSLIIDTFLPYVVTLLEIMGTAVIFIAAVKSFYSYCKNISNPNDEEIKLTLARALALALEFKLGAEILKTVLIRTMDEMYILAAVIILRTILTFVIHWEIKSASKTKNLQNQKESETTE